MSTAEQTRKWTSSAGPIQTKKVNEAINALRWHGKTSIQVYDYGKMQTTQPFGEVREEITNAMTEIGERYNYEVTRENYKAIIAACDLAIKMNPIPEVDCRLSDEEKEQERIEREEIKRKQDEQAAQRKAEYDKAIVELRAKYPWARDDYKLTPHARCAANVREELRRTFPGHKFRVTSESYSGGNSIDVKWSMGPTVDEVKAITGKYVAGSFDGMTDSYTYEYSGYSDAVRAVLGQIKYLSNDRDTEPCFELLARAICERQKVEYKERYQWGTFGDMDRTPLSGHVHAMLANVSFPVGAVVTGIEDYPWQEWEAAGRPGSHTPYRVVFDAPEVSTDYTVDVSGPEREDGQASFCYVVTALNRDAASKAAIDHHKADTGNDDVVLVSIVKGVPAADCGFSWNDLRATTDMPSAPTEGTGYRIEKHHHTKRGFDFFLVILNDRVDADRFEQLRASCEAADGWYSRKWGRTPGGFAFKSEQAAIAWANGSVHGL
jgi:hypothetical protein